MVRTINWACYMLPLFKTFLRSNAPPAHTRQVPMICFRPDDVEGFRCPHLCSFSVLVLFWGSGTSSERRRLDSWVYGGFLAGSTRWRCLAFWRSPDGVESPFAQPGLSELKVPLEVRLAADRGRRSPAQLVQAFREFQAIQFAKRSLVFARAELQRQTALRHGPGSTIWAEIGSSAGLTASDSPTRHVSFVQVLSCRCSLGSTPRRAVTAQGPAFLDGECGGGDQEF